jgi:hypothetical protein
MTAGPRCRHVADLRGLRHRSARPSRLGGLGSHWDLRISAGLAACVIGFQFYNRSALLKVLRR